MVGEKIIRVAISWLAHFDTCITTCNRSF